MEAGGRESAPGRQGRRKATPLATALRPEVGGPGRGADLVNNRPCKKSLFKLQAVSTSHGPEACAGRDTTLQWRRSTATARGDARH